MDFKIDSMQDPGTKVSVHSIIGREQHQPTEMRYGEIARCIAQSCLQTDRGGQAPLKA